MTTAEVRVPRGRGLGIPDARSLRIRVEDERLVLHAPGAEPRVITAVPSATGVVWLAPDETLRLLAPLSRRLLARLPLGRRRLARATGAPDLAAAIPADPRSSSGALVVLEGDRPALALELNAFVSGGHDDAAVRDLSGANRLARALGLVIERADASTLDRAALRSVLVEPSRPAPSWVLASALLCLAAAAVGLAGWPFPDTLSDRTHAALALAGCLLLVPPVLAMALGRRRWLAVVDDPPDPAGRQVVDLGPFGQLQVGKRDVVIADPAGVEHWLPGPDVGGISACELGDDVLTWLTPSAVVVGPPFQRTDLAPDRDGRERLRDACHAAGITFKDAAEMPNRHAQAVPYDLTYDLNWRHPVSERGWEVGVLGVMTEYLSLVAVLVLLPAVIGGVSFGPAWTWLTLVLWVGLAAVRTWTGLAIRHWRRALIRRQSVPVEETP